MSAATSAAEIIEAGMFATRCVKGRREPCQAAKRTGATLAPIAGAFNA